MRVPLDRLLLLLPLALGVWLCADLAALWAARLGHPFDLEWMEGGVLVHAWRLAAGEPIYVEPSPDFVPMIYPPGYPALLAALGGVFGLGHPLGRAVSLLGTLAAAAALVWFAHRDLRRADLGLLAAFVWLGTYRATGGFFDLVRADALMVGLLAWSVVLAASPSGRSRAVAGLLLALAYTTKQNAAAFGPGLLALVAARHGAGAGVRFALWSAVPAGAYTAWMQWQTDGLFLTYLVGVPRSHPLVGDRVWPGTFRELGGALPAALAVVTAALILDVKRLASAAPSTAAGAVALGGGLTAAIATQLPAIRGISSHAAWQEALGAAQPGVIAALVLVLLAAAVAARGNSEPKEQVAIRFGAALTLLWATAWLLAALMRGHHGGFINVFMVLFWGICAALVLGSARLWTHLPRVGPGLVCLGVAAQLHLSHRDLNPNELRPHPDDRMAGEALVRELAALPGPVWSPIAPWLAVQAGHRPGPHLIALWDVIHPDSPFPHQRGVFQAAIAGRHWKTVVDGRPSLGMGLPRHYEAVHTAPIAGRTLMPRTGWRRRPQVLLAPLPKESP